MGGGGFESALVKALECGSCDYESQFLQMRIYRPVNNYQKVTGRCLTSYSFRGVQEDKRDMCAESDRQVVVLKGPENAGNLTPSPPSIAKHLTGQKIELNHRSYCWGLE